MPTGDGGRDTPRRRRMSQEKKLEPFAEIPESFRGLKTDEVYYVDKTAFIPYLIKRKRNICVFTRPRRFGKTLMLRPTRIAAHG